MKIYVVNNQILMLFSDFIYEIVLYNLHSNDYLSYFENDTENSLVRVCVCERERELFVH